MNVYILYYHSLLSRDGMNVSSRPGAQGSNPVPNPPVRVEYSTRTDVFFNLQFYRKRKISKYKQQQKSIIYCPATARPVPGPPIANYGGRQRNRLWQY